MNEIQRIWLIPHGQQLSQDETTHFFAFHIEYFFQLNRPWCRHRRALNVSSGEVTQKRNEAIMENHIKDSRAISQRASRRHGKHSRTQLMSQTKPASFVSAESHATCRFWPRWFWKRAKDAEETAARQQSVKPQKVSSRTMAPTPLSYFYLHTVLLRSQGALSSRLALTPLIS